MTNDWDSISALAPPAPAKSVTPDWDSISKPDTATATDYLRAGESGLTFGTGSNINAAARYLVGNKTAAGSGTYDDLLAEERARLHNVHNQDPLGAGAAELAGGLALPGGLALRGAAKAAALGAPAAATLGEAVYGGAKTGAAYGAASGFGNTESDKDTLVGQVGDRIGGAIEGGAAGAVIGGVIPAATSLIGNVASSAKNAISPAIARATSGPDAAADRIIANRLQNTGRTVDDVRNDIAQRQSDKMIAPGTTPSDVTALADAVPELAPILGSAVRASPEARQQAKEFFAARQRGEAIGDSANSVAAAGVETRPAFTPRDATLTKAPPAGQRERIVDALQDALDIGKNPPTAYSATENLLNSARRTADIKYDASRAAGQGVDLVPHIGPVLDQWQTIVDNSVPGIASPLRNAMAQFRTANGIVNDIGRFDQAKRVVDDAIGNYHNGIGTRSATVAAR